MTRAMTERYRLYLEMTPRHKLFAICRSLERDGLEYRAELDLERQCVTICASGKVKAQVSA